MTQLVHTTGLTNLSCKHHVPRTSSQGRELTQNTTSRELFIEGGFHFGKLLPGLVLFHHFLGADFVDYGLILSRLHTRCIYRAWGCKRIKVHDTKIPTYSPKTLWRTQKQDFIFKMFYFQTTPWRNLVLTKQTLNHKYNTFSTWQ